MNKSYFDRLPVLIVLFAVLFSYASTAEIYKYKDKSGRWQFTDKPPESNTQVEKISLKEEKAEPVSKNLKQALLDKFNPQTVMESATISVVKVETLMGTGSGFFITETGYLVTNRHVIRPPKQHKDEREKEFKAIEGRLENNRSVIAYRLNSQKLEKKELNDYAEYIAGLSSSERPAEQLDYNNRKKRYLAYKAETAKMQRANKRDIKKFSNLKNNYNRQTANAAVARQFVIVLKDDTRLQAELVSIGDKYDLALLKVNDYTVPHLELAKGSLTRQTDTVYAIGSPLGNKDYITSGIVTSLKKDVIVIDAQILPGNSGGPLIDEGGKVVGVNTWKLVQSGSLLSDGFGLAIPVDKLKQTFADFFESAKKEQQFSKDTTTKSDANNDKTSTEKNNELLKSILEDYQSK